MIQKTTSFTTSDGTIHATIEAAQTHEIKLFLEANLEAKPLSNSDFAEFLILKKDHIVDLLTMKASSKPRARKINGGTKKRADKASANSAADKSQPKLV